MDEAITPKSAPIRKQQFVLVDLRGKEYTKHDTEEEARTQGLILRAAIGQPVQIKVR